MRKIGIKQIAVTWKILLLAAVTVVAWCDDTITVKIDEFLSHTYRADQPGAAVIVVQDGKVIFRKGYGLANVELGVPIKPEMVFRIGSMTKQFTAVAVMMLVEEGKIGLDDDIRTYLTDYPNPGKKITVRNLLTHTSGIPELLEIKAWEKHVRDPITPDELISFFKDKPLDFAPGEKWSYSNSGYVLLGKIIEEVSGKSWTDFLRERIFKPLNLIHTDIDDNRTIVPGHVEGYQKVGDEIIHAPMVDMSHPYGGGSIYSSVDDLAKWDEALYTNKLISKSSLEQCFTPVVLNNGKTAPYGFGWMVQQFLGRKEIHHGGRIYGFLSEGIWLPHEHLYVAVLSNIEDPSSMPPKLVAESVVTIALGEPFNMMQTAGIVLTPEELKAYAGDYRHQAGFVLNIILDDGKLYVVTPGNTKDELVPQSRTKFLVPTKRAEIDFELDDTGKAIKMIIKAGPEGSRENVLTRVDQP